MEEIWRFFEEIKLHEKGITYLTKVVGGVDFFHNQNDIEEARFWTRDMRDPTIFCHLKFLARDTRRSHVPVWLNILLIVYFKFLLWVGEPQLSYVLWTLKFSNCRVTFKYVIFKAMIDKNITKLNWDLNINRT